MSLLILPLVALGLLLVPVAPVAAACGGTTIVNDETELNAAIVDFNSQAGPCVFTIEQVDYIFLQADTTPIANANAGVELIYNGNDNLLHGESQYWPIYIDTGSVVTINHLDIESGYTDTVFDFGGGDTIAGGGILVREATLTINDSQVSFNDTYSQLSNPLTGGAGIYAHDSTVTINRSSIERNQVTNTELSASFGGGIFAFGGELYLVKVWCETTA